MPELHKLDGTSPGIIKFVCQGPRFVTLLNSALRDVVLMEKDTGLWKEEESFCFYCHAGRHRSVALVIALSEELQKHYGWEAVVN